MVGNRWRGIPPIHGEIMAGDPWEMVHEVHPTDGATGSFGPAGGWIRVGQTHTDGGGFPRFMGEIMAGDPWETVHVVHPTGGATGFIGPSG